MAKKNTTDKTGGTESSYKDECPQKMREPRANRDTLL